MKLVLSYLDNLAGTAFWCTARMTLFISHSRLFCYNMETMMQVGSFTVHSANLYCNCEMKEYSLSFEIQPLDKPNFEKHCYLCDIIGKK